MVDELIEIYVETVGIPLEEAVHIDSFRESLKLFFERAVNLYGRDGLYEAYTFLVSRLSMAVLSISSLYKGVGDPDETLLEMGRYHELELNNDELYINERHRRLVEAAIEVEKWLLHSLINLFKRLREINLVIDPWIVAEKFMLALTPYIGRIFKEHIEWSSSSTE